MSDIERLRVVATVARTHSISEAARVHGIAQSTVTRSVAAAEQLVGFPLFQRGPAGSQQAAGAQPAIALIERIVGGFDELRALNDERPPALRFAHRADLPIPVRLDSAMARWNRGNTLRAEPVVLDDPLAAVRAGRVEFAVLLRGGPLLPGLRTAIVHLLRPERVELLCLPDPTGATDEFLRLV
ncbi:LysR family transcriptional regulator [Tsukamurella sp. 1534]|uniref:LysR family transcriptional regulator n=1 Tax=Tsukamurella sp. 1534 TaxID=1151061 RepID=UPI0002E45980|nr:LysR family transcriptional regulator [Tsukamurella sp. 1534]